MNEHQLRRGRPDARRIKYDLDQRIYLADENTGEIILAHFTDCPENRLRRDSDGEVTHWTVSADEGTSTHHGGDVWDERSERIAPVVRNECWDVWTKHPNAGVFAR